MGADQHSVSGLQSGGIIGPSDAHAVQLIHHMAVVDDIAQHPAGASLRSGIPSQLHRPFHAIAKTGAFGKKYLHRVSPPNA